MGTEMGTETGDGWAEQEEEAVAEGNRLNDAAVAAEVPAASANSKCGSRARHTSAIRLCYHSMPAPG